MFLARYRPCVLHELYGIRLPPRPHVCVCVAAAVLPIASSVFFGCTSTEIHQGQEKKVFSLRRISPYSQHCWNAPFEAIFHSGRMFFRAFLNTHTPPEELRSSQPTTPAALGIGCNHQRSAFLSFFLFFPSLPCARYRLLQQRQNLKLNSLLEKWPCTAE